MADPLLNVRDDPSCIGLVPAPVKPFGSEAELDDEVVGEVLWVNFTAFLLP